VPTSVIDVAEAFCSVRTPASMLEMPGRVLYELGDGVRRFYASQPAASMDQDGGAYLGGWPSANYGAVRGDLLLTSLLYNEHIVVKDPLYDWFAPEQYLNEHKLAARPGYMTSDGQPNVRETRRYIANALARLAHIQPLVDRGLVRLVPGEALVNAGNSATEKLSAAVISRLLPLIDDYVQRFTPGDIPVEDNLRGMFAFVGGEAAEQYARTLRSAVEYFAREFVLAESSGADYVAPFAHEKFLVDKGVGSAISPSGGVTTALMASDVPIFSGLTPSLVAKIHDDDAFGEFRQTLHEVYQNAPANNADELREYVRDQDRALLSPRLYEARRLGSGSLLREAGLTLKGSAFGIVAGLAVDVTAGTPGIATALGALGPIGSTMIERRRARGGSQRIWSALVNHSGQVSSELDGVEVHDRQGMRGSAGWGIPQLPSDLLTISEGAIFADWMDVPSPAQGVGGFVEGEYRPCDCGSGRKFRFCCKGIALR